MAKELTDRADALRKRQQYLEAAAHYEAAWQKEASPYVARWLIYCRRKSGDLTGAAATAAASLNRFPDHSYLKTEYAWVFYDGKVKEARDSGDLERLIACAWETLGLSSDELLTARVAQAVVKLAKAQPQPSWEVIAEWAAMINPERLSDSKRVTGEGKTFMSEREEWFVGLARALMETGRYEEARRMAQEGLKQFPGEIFLLRTSALARFHGGDFEAGAAEMRNLRHLPRFDWYMKAELAEMESYLGHKEEAYRLICEALENPRTTNSSSAPSRFWPIWPSTWENRPLPPPMSPWPGQSGRRKDGRNRCRWKNWNDAPIPPSPRRERNGRSFRMIYGSCPAIAGCCVSANKKRGRRKSLRG